MKSLAPIVGLTRPGKNLYINTTWFLTRSMSTHYDTLGIKRNASNDDIKNAFVKLSKKYHPDVSAHKNTAQKFSEVAEAYAVLGNDKSKRIYDKVHNSVPSSSYSGNYGSGGERVVYRSSDPNDNSFHDLRQRRYQQVNYHKMQFSQDRASQDQFFARGQAYMAVTLGVSLGFMTFILVVRKNTSESLQVREQRALEMHQLVTGKSVLPFEKMNLDRPIERSQERASERLREFKI
ncbi:chaperone protein dnaJ 1, mitochondrial-like [Pecten maximus]|uniref:chaperone protein dnaJ 1, mitochondrial-like n=1 Tax=Pecten maximus TaxID=6579 RepID=UPI0014588C39|nr:chaperone protein dnaJ 1, mitochondrial-like [Pecten maximus]